MPSGHGPAVTISSHLLERLKMKVILHDISINAREVLPVTINTKRTPINSFSHRRVFLEEK